MALFKWVMDRFIYIVVISLLLMAGYTMYVFNEGKIDTETAKVYFQALTALATLALLFYAYSNVASKREEDAARLELAVRPILVWELESEKGRTRLVYHSLKHPIYDFRVNVRLGNKAFAVSERHIDVSDDKNMDEHFRDLTDFMKGALGSAKQGKVELFFTYHSEVGGKYEADFSKEVVAGKSGMQFQHRKFVSAKYPWKEQKIIFDDDVD
ncbi:MAG: hypothetical protein NT051_05035 [Candidatus Micrarchaeota archaeon]|nr:hypothetical protein [Candidatus Micrarchaeota archaeon]